MPTDLLLRVAYTDYHRIIGSKLDLVTHDELILNVNNISDYADGKYVIVDEAHEFFYPKTKIKESVELFA